MNRSRLRLPLVHLNLTVADLERSIAFYRRWFGFDHPHRTYPDGTVFLGNADGFDFALHPGTPPRRRPAEIHFGFRSDDPDTVRSLRRDLGAAGVAITESYDTPEFVNVKCLDPDGYEIEVYWESPSGSSEGQA